MSPFMAHRYVSILRVTICQGARSKRRVLPRHRTWGTLGGPSVEVDGLTLCRGKLERDLSRGLPTGGLVNANVVTPVHP